MISTIFERASARRLAAVAVCVGVGVLAAAFPALAGAAPRPYDSQIAGFKEPTAVTVGAEDQIWISDTSTGAISQWSAYPSQEKLGQQTGGGRWGGEEGVRGPAISAENGYLLAPKGGPTGSCGAEPYFMFDNFGNFILENELGGFACQGWGAADSSATSPSRGRFYLYTVGSSGVGIFAFDGYGNPVKFSGSASYIAGNEINGTPNGSFSGNASGSFDPNRSGMTVDSEGDIWIVEAAEKKVDEFSPSGVFIREIDLETVPGGFGGGQYSESAGGVAVDPTNGNVLVVDMAHKLIDEFDSTGEYLNQITGSDTPAGDFAGTLTGVAVNEEGYVYVADPGNHVVDIFKPRAAYPSISEEADSNPTTTSGTVNATLDPNGGGPITGCVVEYGTDTEYGQTAGCSPDPGGGSFSSPTQVEADLTGLTTETTYHYRFVATNANGSRAGRDQTYTPHAVVGLRAEAPSPLGATEATLNGSFVGNGSDTTYKLEWGPTSKYGHTTPTADASSPSGPGRTALSAPIEGLAPGTQYHFRVVAENGSTSESDDLLFKTRPVKPQVSQSVSAVHSDQLVFNAKINPSGADTTYHFEYGTEPCSASQCTVATPIDAHAGSNNEFDSVSQPYTGLAPGTLYYYRVVATNAAGTTVGPDLTFATYPFASLGDECPNNLARQQTGAALLPDCRAYELVSALTGGYDVESTLVEGQTPFEGFPLAENPPRVLYGVHDGAIPGTGNPPNRGVDPYIATRTESGWTTKYVGVPATASPTPFTSSVSGADAELSSLAFGGAEICEHCFPDGTGGVPIRLVDGDLVQGMAGSEPVAEPQPAGETRVPLSSDGTHFVFGSTQKFEPTGNPDNGNVTIYNRDLAGLTEVASTDPSGATMADGDDVAELDLSADGSRTLIGEQIGEEDGVKLWHLYMHISGNPDSIDLTPGTSSGVVFNGMTSNGSMVYFTTVDSLNTASNQDTDTSNDLYRSEVGTSSATLTRVSTGIDGAGNSDACSPATNWNVPGGSGKCGTVAFGGGAGVAAGDGNVYFLSPELLAGPFNGEAGEANLYLARPGETDPEFIGILDSSAYEPGPKPPSHVLENASFIGGLSSANQLAVDQQTGEIYIVERFTQTVSRFSSSGAPSNFSSLSSNQLTGQNFGGPGENQIAVDSDPSSPLSGAIYTTTNGATVNVYAHSGSKLGVLNAGGEICGVSVDQNTGEVYLGKYGSTVIRYKPISASPLTFGEREEINITGGLCNISEDSNGHVYAWNYNGGAINQYPTSDFAPGGASSTGTEVASGVHAQNDPENGDLYVNQTSKISRYDSAGNKIEEFGEGILHNSFGVAINEHTKTVYASAGTGVAEFELVTPTYHAILNPAVLHAVEEPEVHHYGDFQVTPDGRFAAFATLVPLESDYVNEGHTEVYRYDANEKSLSCVSCNPTNADATGDASLAADGLSLIGDGRVFFDTSDVLALRDADEREDVYEWQENGVGTCTPQSPNYFNRAGTCVSLISAGSSPFNSSLLSATENGTDVYFFTHDTLAKGDLNGSVTKIYDARTNGGTFVIPPPALCAASDECHGPGSQAPPPPELRTRAGGPGNVPATKKCKKGQVRKNGKCVAKKKNKKKGKKHGKHNSRRQGR